MSELHEFYIQLSSPQVVYYPGQAISGYLVVDLNQPFEMKTIRIKLSGKGYCHWSETVGTGDDRRTQYYSDKETMVKQETYLFGSADSTNVTLNPGKQSHYFSFNFPTNIPSSFEGREGYIRYMLKGEINRNRGSKHKVKVVVTVNDLIDPNLPMYKKALGGETRKQVGFWCCAAGSLDVSASIDRSAYCPGEAILITANVANQTTRSMRKLHAKLIQRVSCHAEGRNNVSKKVISKLDGPPIPPGEYSKWEKQPFGIPAIPPTIRNSKVLTVEYDVKVVVDVPWSLDPNVKMNIVIGTIPYIAAYGQSFEYGTAYDHQGPPEANYMNGQNYAPPQPSVLGYPDMQPPSYSAVVGITDTNSAEYKEPNKVEKMTYNPVYTFAQPYHGTVLPYNTQYPESNQALDDVAAQYPASTMI